MPLRLTSVRWLKVASLLSPIAGEIWVIIRLLACLGHLELTRLIILELKRDLIIPGGMVGICHLENYSRYYCSTMYYIILLVLVPENLTPSKGSHDT